MEVTFPGRAGTLVGWLSRPEVDTFPPVGLIMVPGFPAAPGGGANSFRTFPALADRIAEDARMSVLAVALRGTDESQGNFSLGGWQSDLASAIEYLRTETAVEIVWLIGFGTGGALVVQAAANDNRVGGAVTVAAPADFQDWAGRPRELLAHARHCGAISDDAFPPDFGQWSRELQGLSTVDEAHKLGNRIPMMVVHGSSDDAVPVLDARAIANAHGNAELRIIEGGRHHLRHDPRALAVMIGFLARRGRQPTELG